MTRNEWQTKLTPGTLSKKQAVAAADALILKVEAERQRNLERRTARWVRLYPVLKGVPAEDREALVNAAFGSPVTRWVMGGLALATVLAGLWVLFGGSSAGIGSIPQRAYPLVGLGGMSLVLAQYLCIRAFLRKEVPKRYMLRSTRLDNTFAND